MSEKIKVPNWTYDQKSKACILSHTFPDLRNRFEKRENRGRLIPIFKNKICVFVFSKH